MVRHLKSVPPWVKNVLQEMARQALPTVDGKAVIAMWSDERPEKFEYALGAVFGHVFAAAALCRAGRPPFSGEKLASHRKEISMIEAVKGALTSMCDCPLEEAKEFFHGFSKALSKGTFDSDGNTAGCTQATWILNALVGHWREVESMKKVPELTRWLREYFEKNHPNLADGINDERIQKICERYKIKLRNPLR